MRHTLCYKHSFSSIMAHPVLTTTQDQIWYTNLQVVWPKLARNS